MCIVGKVVFLLVRYCTVMNELSRKIISKLPYGDDFRFVDEITFVNDYRIVGNYTFRADAPYYASNYPHYAKLPTGKILKANVESANTQAHAVVVALWRTIRQAILLPKTQPVLLIA